MLVRRHSIRRVFWNLTEKCRHNVIISLSSCTRSAFLIISEWIGCQNFQNLIYSTLTSLLHGSRFKEITLSCILSNWEFFIKVRVPSLLPPPFIERQARQLSFWWNLSIWRETFVFAWSLKENIQNIILGYLNKNTLGVFNFNGCSL